MTDVSQTLPMTHDTSSLVPPYNARIKRGKGSGAASVSSTWRRPPWLYDGPLTDRVRLRSCNRCRRPILEALADTVMPARIDLVRLTPQQELQAHVAGVMVLRLVPDPPSPWIHARLCFRWPEQIRTRPGRGLPVHDCARTWGPLDRDLIHPRTTAFTEDPTW